MASLQMTQHSVVKLSLILKKLQNNSIFIKKQGNECPVFFIYQDCY
ncbi:Uncharacterised protein [Klebsiella pneumoniae]|nr:Uncharacterised protein [Klebsiella pneumoniae]